MPPTIEQTLTLARAANVRRFHTVQVIGDQNLGHHSHRVCLILRYLLGGEVSSHLMWAALFHDLAESVTGDIPAQAKWASEELNGVISDWETEWHGDHGSWVKLRDDEQLLLSIADKLELVLFCTEQMMLGNRHMEVIRDRGIQFCHENLSGLDAEVRTCIYNFIERCQDEC